MACVVNVSCKSVTEDSLESIRVQARGNTSLAVIFDPLPSRRVTSGRRCEESLQGIHLGDHLPDESGRGYRCRRRLLYVLDFA